MPAPPASAARPARLKRNIASLVGGIAIAAAVLVLWILLTDAKDGWMVGAGVALALAVGVWVRLADL